jgi:hypothetical protein
MTGVGAMVERGAVRVFKHLDRLAIEDELLVVVALDIAA